MIHDLPDLTTKLTEEARRAEAALDRAGDRGSVQRRRGRRGGDLATSIFLVGWAIGGIGFGIMGDRLGRVRTLMLTILLYSRVHRA